MTGSLLPGWCDPPARPDRIGAAIDHDKKTDEPMRTKADLPKKICPACSRPFTWRRKWAKDWDAVRWCSDRCRRDRNRAERDGRSAESGGTAAPAPGRS